MLDTSDSPRTRCPCGSTTLQLRAALMRARTFFIEPRTVHCRECMINPSVCPTRSNSKAGTERRHPLQLVAPGVRRVMLELQPVSLVWRACICSQRRGRFLRHCTSSREREQRRYPRLSFNGRSVMARRPGPYGMNAGAAYGPSPGRLEGTPRTSSTPRTPYGGGMADDRLSVADTEATGAEELECICAICTCGQHRCPPAGPPRVPFEG
jgi:hypothetical protein